ncbi:MAG: ATP-binding protein [Steroidobacteraceae bacterium]
MLHADRTDDRAVWIVPPTRRDGEVSYAMFERAGIACNICASVEALAADIELGIGTALITDASLFDPRMSAVFTALDKQPAWSDVPVIVMAQVGPQSEAASHVLRAFSNVTLLDRPTTTRTLVSSVQTAIRGRERQYQIREQLQSLRAAEGTVREAADRLALGVQVSGVALAEVNYDTSEYRLSAEASALFGIGDSPQVVSLERLLEVIHSDDRAMLARSLRRHPESPRRGNSPTEFRVLWPDGQVRWVSQRDRVFFDPADNKPVRAVVAAMDVTDRTNAERRKDEFLATLAHELRNPLAPIRTGLQVLARGPMDAPPTIAIREMMERQLSQLVRLIDDLLDVSRISSGKVVLQRRRVDLRNAVELALEASNPFVEAGHHELAVQWPTEPVWVHGDSSRLAQVVSNLINNAAKYTPDHGRIILSLSRENEDALVRVTDNGAGIPPEMLSEVFEMFTQIDRTLDRAQGGLGIGLTLVRRLVELHGGRVSAESGGLGEGSSFTIRLPVISAPPTRQSGAARSDAAVAPHTALRLLIVDDNRDGADSLAMLLDVDGYDTRTAYTGPEALQIAAQFRPQVVLCDIGLPEMNGHEVARHLRANPINADMTLVALTGWGSAEDRRRSREAGFDHHLTKPVAPEAVEKMLAVLTQQASALTR